MHAFTPLDYAVVAAYVTASLAIGLYHARRQQNRFAATATLRTEARLAAWLLDEAAAAANSRVTLPDTQEFLADLLGVTRVTINRALTRLRRDGLIAVQCRAVDILAPELLRLRAGG